MSRLGLLANQCIPQCCTAALAAVLRLSWIKTAVLFNAWPDDICGFKWTKRMKNDCVRNLYWHFCCPSVCVSSYFLKLRQNTQISWCVCVCVCVSCCELRGSAVIWLHVSQQRTKTGGEQQDSNTPHEHHYNPPTHADTHTHMSTQRQSCRLQAITAIIWGKHLGFSLLE